MTAARREGLSRCGMNTGPGVCIPAIERLFKISNEGLKKVPFC
jgi:hypothetical protein